MAVISKTILLGDGRVEPDHDGVASTECQTGACRAGRAKAAPTVTRAWAARA